MAISLHDWVWEDRERLVISLHDWVKKERKMSEKRALKIKLREGLAI